MQHQNGRKRPPTGHVPLQRAGLFLLFRVHLTRLGRALQGFGWNKHAFIMRNAITHDVVACEFSRSKVTVHFLFIAQPDFNDLLMVFKMFCIFFIARRKVKFKLSCDDLLWTRKLSNFINNLFSKLRVNACTNQQNAELIKLISRTRARRMQSNQSNKRTDADKMCHFKPLASR